MFSKVAIPLLSMVTLISVASAESVEITELVNPKLMQMNIKTDKNKCLASMGPLGCLVFLKSKSAFNVSEAVVMPTEAQESVLVENVMLKFRGWKRGYMLSIDAADWEKLGYYDGARRAKARELLKQGAEKIPSEYSIQYWSVSKPAASSK